MDHIDILQEILQYIDIHIKEINFNDSDITSSIEQQ
jgi:hypothetical protein